MALYAFDGTWNEDEEGELAAVTNVVHFCDAYDGDRIEYLEGVGTRFGVLGEVIGGLAGAGSFRRVSEMYDKLVANWMAGDETIDVIGFSRGAAVALDFVNRVTDDGITHEGTVVSQAPPIRFLGLWDTVASFGIPINLGINFHDINIGHKLTVPPTVQHCFHALALDERRQTFEPTRLNPRNQLPNVKELWFRGVHSDVGGGNTHPDKSVKRGLSSIALSWMFEMASNCGLQFKPDASQAAQQLHNPLEPLFPNKDLIVNDKRQVLEGDQVHTSAVGRTLAVGETAKFEVRSADFHSWSGLRFQPGEHYRFHVGAADTWTDKDTECNAAGWKSEGHGLFKTAFFEAAERFRRCPQADWFELIGSVEDNDLDLFRIGLGGPSTFSPTKPGEFYAFANDLKRAYGNNSGSVFLTVERVTGPSPPLPRCDN